ncbi:MAG: serine hydrolase domain-containing protein [Pseudomonadota bacterium]
MPGASLIGRALVLCALLGFLCPAAAYPQAAFNHVQERLFQATLNEGVAECRVPGAVALVRSPQGAIWQGNAGFSDLKAGLPMSRELYFHIGSLTKSFTATLFLQLCDMGLASLDDTVEKWLPGALISGNEITLRNLLQMRSGLDHYDTNAAWGVKFSNEPQYKWPPMELVAIANRQVFPVGSRFDYNNVNYILVGMIIEKALGKSFREAIRDHILTPLGMAKSSVPVDGGMPSPYAKGYLKLDGVVTDVSTHWDSSSFWAAGDMISTVDDMLVWLDALIAGSLLSPAMHAQQFAFVPMESDPQKGYGMGVGDDRGMIGHSGNYNGLYTATLYRLNGYDTLILSNGQAAGGDGNSTASCIQKKFRSLIENLPR